MSEPIKYSFKCPSCGSDVLKQVEKADCIQTSRKIEIEGEEIYLLDANEDIEWSCEYEYFCNKCGEEIGNKENLKKYLTKESGR
jgi:DNA-directed RNA polymerase subunit RPC12/RpoP